MKALLNSGIKFFFITLIVYLFFLSGLYYTRIGGSPWLFYATDGLHWKGGATYQSYHEFNPKNKYDIIILGSSHAYRGYDPRAFYKEGYIAYNLGSNAQTLMNSYFIAKNYITPENCKMVILDIFEGPFMSEGLESSSDLIENISSEQAAWSMALNLRDIRALNMIVLRYVSKPSSLQYLDSTYIGLGYCETPDSVKRLSGYKKSVFKAEKKQLDYFDKLICYFKDKRISVLVVTHPIPKEGEMARHDKFVKVIDPYLKKYNITHLNFALNHQLHSLHHFYDHNHLNKAGVDIFNKMLIGKMREINFIK